MFQYKGLNGNVGMLLLYLADHMRADLTVSIPRSRIAEDLNIRPPRVSERMKAAHEAGLLDTIVHGRERTTAVYKAMFPNLEVRTGESLGGTATRTSPAASRGTDGGVAINKYSPREVTSPNTHSSTSNAPHSSTHPISEEGADQRQLIVKRVGNEVDRETGSATADRETSRAQILDAIQRTAAEGGIYAEAGDDLIDLLSQNYGEEISGHVINYWTVPRKAQDRYEAGKWLTTMLNTLKKEGVTA